MKEKTIFFIFGILQAVTLSLIINFILQNTGIGKDTIFLLSTLFPLSTLIIEYLIYSKKNERKNN